MKGIKGWIFIGATWGVVKPVGRAKKTHTQRRKKRRKGRERAGLWIEWSIGIYIYTERGCVVSALFTKSLQKRRWEDGKKKKKKAKWWNKERRGIYGRADTLSLPQQPTGKEESGGHNMKAKKEEKKNRKIIISPGESAVVAITPSPFSPREPKKRKKKSDAAVVVTNLIPVVFSSSSSKKKEGRLCLLAAGS